MTDDRGAVRHFLASWLRNDRVSGPIGIADDCLWEVSAPLPP